MWENLYFVGISNADFINGRVEDVLPNVLWRIAGRQVMMVVDPPRCGLRAYYRYLQSRWHPLDNFN
jgi:tRNA/tmRNA/rRNA uracil-C5-methylase (TrmA/RlmC/RlmD family)